MCGPRFDARPARLQEDALEPLEADDRGSIADRFG
jgi:hypothetical protein